MRLDLTAARPAHRLHLLAQRLGLALRVGDELRQPLAEALDLTFGHRIAHLAERRQPGDMQLQRGRLRRGQPAGAQGQVQADAEHDDDVVIGISISTGTGRRRNHQFREQPAQLEPVAEHVVRPFEFQRAVRLVRRGTVFLDHAVQSVQRDQSGDHLQPAIDGFVGGDRARNAHGIGHRRAAAGLTDPLVTIAPTTGGLPVGGHHGHRQFAILVVGQRQRPVANHLCGQRVGRIGFVHGDHMICDGCSSG